MRATESLEGRTRTVGGKIERGRRVGEQLTLRSLNPGIGRLAGLLALIYFNHGIEIPHPEGQKPGPHYRDQNYDHDSKCHGHTCFFSCDSP